MHTKASVFQFACCLFSLYNSISLQQCMTAPFYKTVSSLIIQTLQLIIVARCVINDLTFCINKTTASATKKPSTPHLIKHHVLNNIALLKPSKLDLHCLFELILSFILKPTRNTVILQTVKINFVTGYLKVEMLVSNTSK